MYKQFTYSVQCTVYKQCTYSVHTVYSVKCIYIMQCTLLLTVCTVNVQWAVYTVYKVYIQVA